MQVEKLKYSFEILYLMLKNYNLDFFHMKSCMIVWFCLFCVFTKVWNNYRTNYKYWTTPKMVKLWSLSWHKKWNKILWLFKQKNNGIFLFLFLAPNWLFPRLARKRSVTICINLVTFQYSHHPVSMCILSNIIWFCPF